MFGGFVEGIVENDKMERRRRSVREKKRTCFLTRLPTVVEEYCGAPLDLASAVANLKSLLNAHGGELVSTGTREEWKLFKCFYQSLTVKNGVFHNLSGGIHPQFKLFDYISTR